MKFKSRSKTGWIAASFLAGSMLLLSGGCGNPPVDSSASSGSSASSAAQAQATGIPAAGQPVFSTDQEAMDAMITAVKAEDHDQVHRLLGPDWKDLVSGDKVEDGNAFKEFAQRAAENTRLEKQDDATAIIHVGKDDWPFPIPIVRTADGKWFFDTVAGKQEILTRRIGNNELDAIDSCRKYVQAQRDYASKDRDGSDVLKFAQRVLSTPGKKDGLYWDAAAGEEPSPLGHLFAKATTQGYDPTASHPREPYQGYQFRILKRQGAAAPGGAYPYVLNGNMVAGFALVAFPAEYGSSGIMTFIVNQNGKVYQKDLGADTTQVARRMTEYNPDSSWTLVKD